MSKLDESPSVLFLLHICISDPWLLRMLVLEIKNTKVGLRG